MSFRNATPPAEMIIEPLSELLARVREWRDQNSGEPISFDRHEAWLLEAALAEALRTPRRESKLLEHETRRLAALDRLRNQTGESRFRDAIDELKLPYRKKGDPKYPAHRVAWAFHHLTHEQGEVGIANELIAYGGEENCTFEDNCPLAAWDAIDVLVGFFEFPSPTACLKMLQRLRILRLEQIEHGDGPSDLPSLDNLPYAASEPFSD